MPHIRRILSLLFFAFLVSCADRPEEKPKEKEEKPASPKLVGRVASIPADRKFVLIQSYGTWEVGTGVILTSQGRKAVPPIYERPARNSGNMPPPISSPVPWKLATAFSR